MKKVILLVLSFIISSCSSGNGDTIDELDGWARVVSRVSSP